MRQMRLVLVLISCAACTPAGSSSRADTTADSTAVAGASAAQAPVVASPDTSSPPSSSPVVSAPGRPAARPPARQPSASSAPSSPSRTSPSRVAAGSSRAQDSAAIARLEREARALVHTSGCASTDACRAAPVGSRACGGPRYYLVYCPLTTDSAALARKLAEVAAAERAFNRKYQIGSTCEFRMPPRMEATSGSCHALIPASGMTAAGPEKP